MLPFTRDEFMAVFARYHDGTWPAVMAWFILAAVLLAYIYRHVYERYSAGFPLGFLGLLWSWTGAAYMWGYFATINPAAKIFGSLFVIQGVWLLYESGRENFLHVMALPKPEIYSSLFLFFYAFVLYPLIGSLSGHRYPAAPLFGLPCPNTIFTFATLMLVTNSYGRPLKRLMIIPVAWSLVATFAAVQLSVPEDWMLPVAATAALWFMLRQTNRSNSSGLVAAMRV